MPRHLTSVSFPTLNAESLKPNCARYVQPVAHFSKQILPKPKMLLGKLESSSVVYEANVSVAARLTTFSTRSNDLVIVF